MQSNSPTPDTIQILSQTCTICLNSIVFPYCQLNCNHFFCFECIQQWCQRYNSCPLCNNSIDYVFKVSSNNETTKVFIDKKRVEQEISLDCLDHGYFKQEIAKLMRIFYEFEVSRFKHRNSKGTPQEWKVFVYLKNNVETLREENEAFVRFDPQKLLAEVEGIKEKFDLLKNGIVFDLPEEENQECSWDSDDCYED